MAHPIRRWPGAPGSPRRRPARPRRRSSWPRRRGWRASAAAYEALTSSIPAATHSPIRATWRSPPRARRAPQRRRRRPSTRGRSAVASNGIRTRPPVDRIDRVVDGGMHHRVHAGFDRTVAARDETRGLSGLARVLTPRDHRICAAALAPGKSNIRHSATAATRWFFMRTSLLTTGVLDEIAERFAKRGLAPIAVSHSMTGTSV